MIFCFMVRALPFRSKMPDENLPGHGCHADAHEKMPLKGAAFFTRLAIGSIWRIVGSDPQPASRASLHIRIISDGIVAVVTVVGIRLHIHQRHRILIKERVAIDRRPEKRTANDDPAPSMEIVEPVETVASLVSAAMVHAVAIAVKTALSVESIVLRKQRTAGRA